MAKRPTRGEKAASTLIQKNEQHFKEIGAEGGSKTTGTFKTKRGLAKLAGQRSGEARRIKKLQREIDTLAGAGTSMIDGDYSDEFKLMLEKKAELDLLIIAQRGGVGAVLDDKGTVIEYLPS